MTAEKRICVQDNCYNVKVTKLTLDSIKSALDWDSIQQTYGNSAEINKFLSNQLQNIISLYSKDKDNQYIQKAASVLDAKGLINGQRMSNIYTSFPNLNIITKYKSQAQCTFKEDCLSVYYKFLFVKNLVDLLQEQRQQGGDIMRTHQPIATKERITMNGQNKVIYMYPHGRIRYIKKNGAYIKI